jgi:hypothetical protein
MMSANEDRARTAEETRVDQGTVTSDVTSVVVIGAGPRGTSVVERLVSRAAAAHAAGDPVRRLNLTVVDPHHPGSGHVWDRGQNRDFLMNTPSFYPTVAPERAHPVDAQRPSRLEENTGAAPDFVVPTEAPGLSFEQFRITGGDGAELTDVERNELGALTRGSYPPRALYGAYLDHVWQRCVDRAAALPLLDGPYHVPATAVAIERAAGHHRVHLDDGRVLHADRVVLAVGHVPARLTPEQEAVGRAVVEAGCGYVPPHVPADLDHSRFPAGEEILVRGMGLNFFDLMIALTKGRGGRFEESGLGPGRALRYVPSGREPVLVAGSRRGTPYLAKSVADAFVPRAVHLRHLTYDRVVGAARKGATGRTPGSVDFERHVWPLLQRDVVEHYYRTLASTSPELFASGPDRFLSELAEVLDHPADIGDEVWTVKVQDLLRQAAPEAGWFDVADLARPFHSVGHTSEAGHAAAVLEWLEKDAAQAHLGEDCPDRQAVGALHAGRLLTKRLVAEGFIDETSVALQVRGRFEPIVEGLASGAPVQRTEELAALVRAGLVRILGPEPTYTFDDEAGRFVASSPWVQGVQETARWMVEAMMPANRVAVTASPLLRDLQASGLGRPHPRTTTDGEIVPGSGFDVVGPDHRLVGADGVASDGIHVLGLQLSSVQWGTAIAAEAGGGPDDGGRTLADADAVALAVLGA